MGRTVKRLGRALSVTHSVAMADRCSHVVTVDMDDGARARREQSMSSAGGILGYLADRLQRQSICERVPMLVPEVVQVIHLETPPALPPIVRTKLVLTLRRWWLLVIPFQRFSPVISSSLLDLAHSRRVKRGSQVPA
jgi:hypothetical protein